VAEKRFEGSPEKIPEKIPEAAAPVVRQPPPRVTAEAGDQGADRTTDQASKRVADRVPDRNSDPSPDANPDPSTDPARLRQNQERWKLSFSLFLLGFMLLIVTAKGNLPAGETWAFRGVAAVVCVGAFFLARQAQRKPKA
jgi:hypothetical protein